MDTSEHLRDPALPNVPPFPFPASCSPVEPKHLAGDFCSQLGISKLSEGTPSDKDAPLQTRTLHINNSHFDGVVQCCYLDESCASERLGPLGFRARKSVVDFMTYWTVEHEVPADCCSPVSPGACAAGVRPGLVLSAVDGQDCLISTQASKMLSELVLPSKVELLELRSLLRLEFDEWPFGFGKMVVEQRSIGQKDLSPAVDISEVDGGRGQVAACLLVRADGLPRSKGAIPGSVVVAVNGVRKPTSQEIQSKAQRLLPQDRKTVEVLLSRPLPLPARASELNRCALTVRQTASGPSGRMLRPQLV